MNKEKDETLKKKPKSKNSGNYIESRVNKGYGRGSAQSVGMRVIEYGSLIISNAKSLQCVAKELDKELYGTSEGFGRALGIDEYDRHLYLGRCIAGPVLFGLAAELALKALRCQEARKYDPPHIHDLVDLFEELGEDTQAELEATFKKLMSPKLPPKVRDILHKNKDVFRDWRYSFEHLSLQCFTVELDELISAIIKTYYKMVEKEGLYKKQLLRDSARARARDLSK